MFIEYFVFQIFLIHRFAELRKPLYLEAKYPSAIDRHIGDISSALFAHRYGGFGRVHRSWKIATKLDNSDDCAAKTRTIHARNIDLEQFERCDGAEGLYVLHVDLGEWYFSFRGSRTVVSWQVHTSSL